MRKDDISDFHPTTRLNTGLKRNRQVLERVEMILKYGKQNRTKQNLSDLQ